jgi:hypothetical protein
MSAITHLIAGVPVSDLDASIEHATLFIEPNPARAGAGRITFVVAGLDALLERLAAQRIEHEPIDTYSDGLRHVKVPDPDGNAIAFAELPDAGRP